MTTLSDFLARAEKEVAARKEAAAQAAVEIDKLFRRRLRFFMVYIFPVLAALAIVFWAYSAWRAAQERAELIAYGLAAENAHFYPDAERPRLSTRYNDTGYSVDFTFNLAANGGRFGGCMEQTEVSLPTGTERREIFQLHRSIETICIPDRLAQIYNAVGGQPSVRDGLQIHVEIRDGRAEVVEEQTRTYRDGRWSAREVSRYRVGQPRPGSAEASRAPTAPSAFDARTYAGRWRVTMNCGGASQEAEMSISYAFGGTVQGPFLYPEDGGAAPSDSPRSVNLYIPNGARTFQISGFGVPVGSGRRAEVRLFGSLAEGQINRLSGTTRSLLGSGRDCGTWSADRL